MATYFISDLHLCAERSGVTELFGEFLASASLDADAIYILGDLFEFWIGDDAVGVLGHTGVFETVSRLADRGIPVYFMPGNRDFLVGEGFETGTGSRLLKDPTEIALDGVKILLSHGDRMCTDDVQHQEFLAIVGDEKWRRGFLSLPVEERIAMARSARSESALHKSMTSMEIMDVNQDAVKREIASHGAAYLVHGHTHRPGIHPVRVDGRDAVRIVLGDWNTHSSVLRYEDGVFRLSAHGVQFPPVELGERRPVGG